MTETKKSSVVFDPSLGVGAVTAPKEIDPVQEIFKDTASKKSRKSKKTSNVKEAGKLFKARTKWPKACLKCYGDGADFSNEDDADDEDDLEIELCGNCLDKGKCPRCAKALPKGWRKNILEFLEPPVKCEGCGWEDGDEPVLPMPEDDEDEE